jgi:IS1 family transposase
VLRELKKKEGVLESVNTALLRTLNPETVAVAITQAGEAEMDAMWSFVGNKGNPRWLWHAIEHHTGKVLASVFGRRQDTVFLQLKALLEPFGITQYYTDYWVPTRVTSILKSIPRASAIRRKSSASTWRYARASNAWSVRPSASRNRCRCTTSSLVYSSIDMPLDGRCKVAISTFETLPYSDCNAAILS